MRKTPYVVGQGDYLAKIAMRVGVDADTLWNDPQNAELKRTRDPNQLHPGDLIYLPGAAPQPLDLAPNTTNRYVADIPTTTVHLALRAFPNEAYEVTGHGLDDKGTTDGDGGLKVEVPLDVHEVRINLTKRGVVQRVRVGGMDPIDEPSGVRKRLQHLGFRGSADTDDDGATEQDDANALRRFQLAHGLPPTGELDDATKAELLKQHGS
jgi:N-acetylmuramoyl-L-alanine amidase